MGAIFLFSGDDAATIAEEARKTVAGLTGPEPDEFALEVIRESDDRDAAATVQDLLGSIQTPSFLGGVKTVWLSGFSAFGDEPPASEKNLSPLAKAMSQLADVIRQGIPDDINLVLSGTGVDSKKPLAKACEAAGKTRFFDQPEVDQRGWERQMQSLIRQRAGERGMTLDAAIVDYLMEAIGADTGRMTTEIEKLYCYGGENPTLEQVQELCVGNRDAGRFALSDAFGQRDLNAVFTTIGRVLDNHKNPDSACIMLTRQMAGVFQRFLHAKLLMQHLKTTPRDLGRAIEGLTPEQEAQFEGNLALGIKNAWYRGKVAEQADCYAGAELVDAVELIAQFDKLNVSSALPRRLALETLALRIITGRRRPA